MTSHPTSTGTTRQSPAPTVPDKTQRFPGMKVKAQEVTEENTPQEGTPMTQPLPADTAVLALFNHLYTLTLDVIEACQNQQVNQISQLMMTRAKVLEEIQQLPLQDLPETLRTQLRDIHGRTQELEPQMLEVLENLKNHIGSQLKQAHGTKDALGSYKIISPSQHVPGDNEA